MNPDYSYQDRLISDTYKALKTNKKVVLAACPGAGKTRMALEVIKRYLSEYPDSKILILTHGQTIIRHQWAGVIAQHFDDFYEVKPRVEIPLDRKVYISLPQARHNLDVLKKIDLLIVDEAHHFVLGSQLKLIIKTLNPSMQLRLTGTPAMYIGDQEWKILGITIQELLRYKTLVDPEIILLESEHPVKLADYSHTYSLNNDQILKEKDILKNVHTVVDVLLKRLGVNKIIDKTMIICHSQFQAKIVHHYLKKQKLNSLISISDFCDGDIEFDQFKTNPDVTFFIVVNRGILGFDYPALANIVDMTETLNVNRIFQALCRAIRANPANPDQKKTVIKLVSKDVSRYAYLVMSFAVALSDARYYYSYSINPNNTKASIPRKEFPIKREFLDTLKSKSLSVGNLPSLLTFKDIKEVGDRGTRVIAYTNFAHVHSLLNGSPNRWTVDQAIEVARRYKHYSKFATAHPGAVAFLIKNNLEELQKVFPPKRVLWSEERIQQELSQIKDWEDLMNNHKKFYRYASRCKRQLLDPLRQRDKLIRWDIESAVKYCKQFKKNGKLTNCRAYRYLKEQNKLNLIEDDRRRLRQNELLTEEMIIKVQKLEKKLGRKEACEHLGVSYHTYYARTARKDRQKKKGTWSCAS